VLPTFEVFWDMMLCGLVNSYQCFVGARCVHLQGTRDKDPENGSLEYIVCNMSREGFKLNSKDLTRMCTALVTKKRRCTKSIYRTIQAAQFVLNKSFSG
jgi:hypothetical protein